MDMRDTGGLDVQRGPELVVSGATAEPAPERPTLVISTTPTPTPPSTPGRRPGRQALVVGGIAVLVLAVLLGTWWARRGDDVSTAAVATAPKPAGVAPLTVAVDVPASVVVGTPATFVVRYDDGAGIFSGGTEDWGDDIGASSLKQGRCDPAASSADPATGSYRVAHTWSEPGRYPVAVGVATYTCVDGSAVTEQATTTVTVEVAAR